MILEYVIVDDTLNGVLDIELLIAELGVASIVVDKLKSTDTKIYITTDSLEAEVDAVIASHGGATATTNAINYYELVVADAMDFFTNIMVHFAAENVIMGVTQAGKTKDVADYLIDVMRYGQSGSLYEVNNKIDELIAATIPVELSPFVTEARLITFKNNVLGYLS